MFSYLISKDVLHCTISAYAFLPAKIKKLVFKTKSPSRHEIKLCDDV